ncbi:hypothetical protein B296_00013540 [Ensete ventricosum]|uniref:Uncharacterized protein n=1 Tax=Ensete ventricosum TaxID=4639 RepID=A0A426X8Y8_ENSVE|nr:hypothetical protein B296_00013540 [Ensete ventricosum]
MKFGDETGSKSVVPLITNTFVTVGVIGSTTEKCPSVREGASLKKRIRKAAFEQPVDASGSTTRSPTEKGKVVVEIEEAHERGYTIQDLCEVEDRAGVDKYFASIMMRLKSIKGEDPLVSMWSTNSSPVVAPVDDVIPCFSPLDSSGGLFVSRESLDAGDRRRITIGDISISRLRQGVGLRVLDVRDLRDIEILNHVNQSTGLGEIPSHVRLSCLETSADLASNQL